MSKQVTKSTLSKINDILGIKESYEAPARVMEILKNPDERKQIFLKFLEDFNYDVSYEWFYNYFQDEHADRKNNKQDFTPKCISNLVSEMLCSKSKSNDYVVVEEPAAGTGSTIISHWYAETRKNNFIWDYRPDDFLYKCTELSNKTIPFLILNLMIRGMNAIVIHGNALTLEAEDVYWIYNENNNPLGFSELYIAPHEERIEKMFGIKFRR